MLVQFDPIIIIRSYGRLEGFNGSLKEWYPKKDNENLIATKTVWKRQIWVLINAGYHLNGTIVDILINLRLKDKDLQEWNDKDGINIVGLRQIALFFFTFFFLALCKELMCLN